MGQMLVGPVFWTEVMHRSFPPPSRWSKNSRSLREVLTTDDADNYE
jgi:hypothetical protein